MAYSAAGSAGILLLHLAVPSLLNFYHWSPRFDRWQSFLAHIVDLHARIVGPFTTRPVTTFLIHQISGVTSLSLWWGFILAQFALLSAAAYALAHLSAQLKSPPLLSLLGFFLSFTIFFSFTTPNDSYDEAAQYLFLFLSLNALIRRRDYQFAVFLFLALLSRETTALLLPGMLILGWAGWRNTWKFSLPVALFSMYYFTSEAAPDPNRFYYWIRNFQSLALTLESFVSFAAAIALPLSLCLAGRSLGALRAYNGWLNAFFLSLALNSSVTFFAAYARESRLFALPLVFLWPLGGLCLSRIWQAWHKRELRLHLDPPRSIAILAAIGLALVFYRPAYRSPGYPILAPLHILLLFVGCLIQSRVRSAKAPQ